MRIFCIGFKYFGVVKLMKRVRKFVPDPGTVRFINHGLDKQTDIQIVEVKTEPHSDR